MLRHVIISLGGDRLFAVAVFKSTGRGALRPVARPDAVVRSGVACAPALFSRFFRHARRLFSYRATVSLAGRRCSVMRF